jgi:hypothetical protein
MANEQNLIPYKKGQSGNPKGMPKGYVHSSTRLRRLLDLTENLKNPVTGELEGFTVLEQLDMQQIIKARKGDLQAYKEIMDRLEGKSAQSVDITTLGKQLPTPIYGGMSVDGELQGHDGDPEDIPTKEKD